VRELTPEVLVADDPLTFVTREDLIGVVARARSVPRKRARILLHTGADDVMQQMMIVMTRGQYVPPHWNSPAAKSYLVLSGSMELARFDNLGNLADHFHLAAEEPGVPFFVRMNQSMWHTCISVSPDVTFLEASTGPYSRTIFADWAPAADGRAAATEFFQRVCSHCGVPSE
jgi:cupin fold WbuC family metalloprotein